MPFGLCISATNAVVSLACQDALGSLTGLPSCHEVIATNVTSRCELRDRTDKDALGAFGVGGHMNVRLLIFSGMPETFSRGIHRLPVYIMQKRPLMPSFGVLFFSVVSSSKLLNKQLSFRKGKPLWRSCVWRIYSSCYYHHQIGSIHLSHCYHIFPWMCAWDVCYIIFCHLLHIYSGKTGNLFSLSLCSLWWVQIFGYV